MNRNAGSIAVTNAIHAKTIIILNGLHAAAAADGRIAVKQASEYGHRFLGTSMSGVQKAK